MESAKQIHINHWLAALVKVKCWSTKPTYLTTGMVCHPDTEQNRPVKNPLALLGIELGPTAPKARALPVCHTTQSCLTNKLFNWSVRAIHGLTVMCSNPYSWNFETFETQHFRCFSTAAFKPIYLCVQTFSVWSITILWSVFLDICWINEKIFTFLWMHPELTYLSFHNHPISLPEGESKKGKVPHPSVRHIACSRVSSSQPVYESSTVCQMCPLHQYKVNPVQTLSTFK